MPHSATLALGQASYELIEVLDPTSAEVVASLRTKGSTQTLSAVKRGGEISEIGILGDGTTTLNITDRSSKLFYADDDITDDDAEILDLDSKINLLANSSFSTFELGSGFNRFNAARDFTDSEVTSHEGADTIRIGGIADGSFVSTGDGADQFTANRRSEGLDVVMSGGDDTALFLGTLTAGINLVTPTEYNVPQGEEFFFIKDAQNIVDMGDGDDSATFLGGVHAAPPITFTVDEVLESVSVNTLPDFYSNLIITSVTSNEGGTAFLNDDGTITFTPIAFNGDADFEFSYSYLDNEGEERSGSATAEGTITSGYEIQLGAGYDNVVFGANSTSDGFLLNTGTGSDYVKLGRTTTNAVIDLGWDNGVNGEIEYNENSGLDYNYDLEDEQGDFVVLGVDATLADSLIRSGQSKDVLILNGTVTDTTLDLGWGNSEVDVFDVVGFSDDTEAFWDLGGGNDTLRFSKYSEISALGDESYGFFYLGTGADSLSLLGTGFGEWGAIKFDLGDDNDIDTIQLGLDLAYSGLLIKNFGDEDILIIGSDSYGYDLLRSGYSDENLDTFFEAGNYIQGIHYY